MFNIYRESLLQVDVFLFVEAHIAADFGEILRKGFEFRHSLQEIAELFNRAVLGLQKRKRVAGIRPIGIGKANWGVPLYRNRKPCVIVTGRIDPRARTELGQVPLAVLIGAAKMAGC